MAHEPTETKTALILAAGELFAKHGIEGVGIRTIAEKAKVNIAAVNYHFGGKENLYAAALWYAAQCGETDPLGAPQEDDRFHTREGLASMLVELIRAKFESYFASDTPRWCAKLLMRSMLAPSSALNAVVDRTFRPQHERTKAILRQAKPDLSEREAEVRALDITARISIYITARVPILMVLEREDFDPEYLEEAAHHIITTTLMALNLPVPSDVYFSLDSGNLEVRTA